jgi:hypothetical protein
MTSNLPPLPVQQETQQLPETLLQKPEFQEYTDFEVDIPVNSRQEVKELSKNLISEAEQVEMRRPTAPSQEDADRADGGAQTQLLMQAAS